MPSSQDVLPSASMLTWIGGGKKKWGAGSANYYTNPPSITSVLLGGRLCITLRKISACFLCPRREKRHRGWRRCRPCHAPVVSASRLPLREGETVLEGRNGNVSPNSFYKRCLERDSSKG